MPSDDIKKKVTISDDRMAVLAIAYHNLGVEFEHLKRVIILILINKFDEAIKIYSKALRFAKENLAMNHHLISNLTKVLNTA